VVAEAVVGDVVVDSPEVKQHIAIVPLAETTTVIKAPVKRLKMAIVLAVSKVLVLDVPAVVLAALVAAVIVTAVLTELITRNKLDMAGVKTLVKVNGRMRKQAKLLLHKKSKKADGMLTQRLLLLLLVAMLSPNKSPSQKTTASPTLITWPNKLPRN